MRNIEEEKEKWVCERKEKAMSLVTSYALSRWKRNWDALCDADYDCYFPAVSNYILEKTSEKLVLCTRS